MNIGSIIFIVSVLLIATGCADSGNNNERCVPGPDDLVSYNDIEGDAAFSFIDVGELSLTVNECAIKVELALLSPPTNLTYNSINVSDNYLEYQWEVQFDIDGDGASSNDVSLSVSRFKPPGSLEQQGDVPDFTQNNLWRISSNGSSGSYEGDVSVSLSGSTLIIVANKSESDLLSMITTGTSYKIETFYNSGGTVYRDLYPDGGGYTN